MTEPAIPAAAYLCAAPGDPNAIPRGRAALQTFAQAHSLAIVRWFTDAAAESADEGGPVPRPALASLRAQAAHGCDFEYVLTEAAAGFDRDHPGDWQALDAELRAAGVHPLYVGEPHRNDGRALGRRIKALYAEEFRDDARRAHRALSAAGLRHAVAQGFHPGAPAPFGLRRQVIGWNQEGRTLEAGENRPRGRYRTVLVPGPAWEVDLVNRAFAMYVLHGLDPGVIARRLNALADPRADPRTDPAARRRWGKRAVRRLLANPLYIGVRLHGRRGVTAAGDGREPAGADRVLRVEGVCEPLVERGLWEAAQCRRRGRARRFTDAEILAGLARLLKAHGVLTRELVDRDPELPGWLAVGRRFGGIGKAMAAVGYAKPSDWEARRAMGRVRGETASIRSTQPPPRSRR